MSYSFGIRAADKAAARAAIAAELDKVIEQQPVHAHDRAQAEAVANAFLDLIPEPENDAKEVSVSVSGWVQWQWESEPKIFSGASVGVSASIVDKPTAG